MSGSLRAVLLAALVVAAAWAAAVSAAAATAAAAAVAPRSSALEPPVARVLADTRPDLPADDDPRWRTTALPDSQQADVAWYRVEFGLTPPPAGAGPGEVAQAGSEPAMHAEGTWMLYLPYLYGGGRVWLNGVPVAAITENSPTLRVRWERPLLLPLPASALRAGTNVLHLRVVSAHQPAGIKLPQLVLGPQAQLQPQFDRRLFFVRTMPVVTVVAGAALGLLVLFIWLRRRQEVAYGLFGLAALLWAVRTTTFVFDALPAAWWVAWRAMYYASTGGFIAVMALFTLNQAGWFRPRIAWALLAYVAIGPLAYLAAGQTAEGFIGRWWVLGLIPVGASVAVVSFITAWRQRTTHAVLLAAAVLLAFVAGIHDYAVAWSSWWLEALLPRWAGHRLFLLHHGANLLLATMGVLLTLRFVRSLQEVEAWNVTLHERVAARERELAAGYERIAALQREQATHEERQRIMRELHDGVGSQLVSALMRAERGALEPAATRDALRSAIDEMRVAIEALAGDDGDLGTAFGNFRFRWDPRLRDAGVVPRWEMDLPDEGPALLPHDILQVLRVLQEALTNVLKHSGARHVTVRLRHEPGRLLLEVADDGRGLPEAVTHAFGDGGPPPAAHAEPARAAGAGASRGLSNMRLRARRIGAVLTFVPGAPGTRLSLVLPLA